MGDSFFYILVGIAGGGLVLIFIGYFLLTKSFNKDDLKYAKELKKNLQSNTFSMDVIYQKLYVFYTKIPFLKRYLAKLRRRLEVISVQDEYITRKEASKSLSFAVVFIIAATIAVVMLTGQNYLLKFILLLYIVFIAEVIIDGKVDKLDDKILVQQIDLFTEIRHAYHETNMVEEAIYEVAQNDEKEVSHQAEKIYEILISNDPEGELEKYYDIAPNSYLKEFAGVSYLTKEFGDRTINNESLYLKNINNISQEMQIEILKRDKLNYVFQSLSIISVAPALCIEPLKKWAVSQFAFTDSFYSGKLGFIVQALILILTIVCFILVRTVKDNGSIQAIVSDNPWQKKLYSNKIIKKIVDLFIPKKGTREFRKIETLLKDAASKLKIEWLYLNRIAICVISFIIAVFAIERIHQIAIDYVYTNTSQDSTIVGMSTEDTFGVQQILKSDNVFLDKYRGKKIKKEALRIAVQSSIDYAEASDEEIDEATERIYKKLQTVNNEYFSALELLIAFAIGYLGYMFPIALLYFQKRMRALDMEDEVMQFQTIILMLMKIERVNVEIILEWLERYANIFKEPITKCVNNYEAGAWEALEELKNDVTYIKFIRIVESLQAAVEKIPISKAFDELDSERDYYQERRKESNNRLITRKGTIGKIVGFAPMICLFILYLVVPMIFIGLSSMTSTFAAMSQMSTL